MRFEASENWLALFGEQDHPNHAIVHLNGLTVARVQAALDKQYGPGQFDVRDHGTVITVWSYRGWAVSLEARYKDRPISEIEERREAVESPWLKDWLTKLIERRRTEEPA